MKTIRTSTPLLICLLSLGLVASSVLRAQDAVPPPGIVIDQSPGGERFIGSPAIVILPDGSYLASHDWFGDDIDIISTEIFRSTDRGASWSQVASIEKLHFASLFYHSDSNAVYLLGTSTNTSPSYVSVHKSTDGGTTWTTATSSTTGRILTAVSNWAFSGAPTPVIEVDGRLWRMFGEKYLPDNLPNFSGIRGFFMSAPVDSNLLLASSWTRTNSIAFDAAWLNAKFPGWLEGNAVEYPAGSGNVVGISRVDTWPDASDDFPLEGEASNNPRYEVAAMMDAIDSDEATFLHDEPTSWLNFPGGQSKFTIRYDPVSGLYWSVVNYIANQHQGVVWLESPMHQRNVLMLASSPALQTWTKRAKVVRWKDGESLGNTGRTGFHYADWQFDGDDIVFVVRNSWNGHTYHDANYFTFHRIVDFRDSTSGQAAPDRGSATFSALSIAAEDGFVLESGENTGVGGSFNATSSSDVALRAGDDPLDQQYRTILSFDTSGLPDSAIVTSAMIKLRRGAQSGTSPFSTHGECHVDIKSGAFSGSTALENADFQAAADATAVALVGNPANAGDWAAVPVSSDGLAFISKTGRTQFRIAFATDDNDDLGWDYVAWHSGDAASGYRPELEVTYEFKASFESLAAEDGHILESSENTNVGGTLNSSSSANIALRGGDDPNDKQYRTIISFDTSSLPDGAVITSAVVKLTRGTVSGTNPFTTFGSCYLDIKGGGGFGGSTALQVQDFEAAADVAHVALLANPPADGDVAAAHVDTAGLAFINKTGRTQFRIAFTTDDNEDGTWDYIGWYSGNSSSGKPVLEVTYR